MWEDVRPKLLKGGNRFGTLLIFGTGGEMTDERKENLSSQP